LECDLRAQIPLKPGPTISEGDLTVGHSGGVGRPAPSEIGMRCLCCAGCRVPSPDRGAPSPGGSGEKIHAAPQSPAMVPSRRPRPDGERVGVRGPRFLVNKYRMNAELWLGQPFTRPGLSWGPWRPQIGPVEFSEAGPPPTPALPRKGGGDFKAFRATHLSPIQPYCGFGGGVPAQSMIRFSGLLFLPLSPDRLAPSRASAHPIHDLRAMRPHPPQPPLHKGGNGTAAALLAADDRAQQKLTLCNGLFSRLNTNPLPVQRARSLRRPTTSMLFQDSDSCEY
jgi:hypothetical protein